MPAWTSGAAHWCSEGAGPGGMFARQLEPPVQEQLHRMSRATLAQFAWAMFLSRRREEDFRRRIGALALAAERAGATPSEEERLQVIRSRLVSQEWPERPLSITAVDAQT